MKKNRETCQQYVARRLSEGWRIISQTGFSVILQSPEGIIRDVDLRNDVETLRPNAAGDETALTKISGYNWQMVDEVNTDEDTTYVYVMGSSYLRDLYNLPAHSVGSGTINSITIYFRIRAYQYNGYGKPVQKTGTTVTLGTAQLQGNTYATKSQTYTLNPATGAAYTWDEIDALQIGVSLKHEYSGTYYTYCTQVYVEVDYTAIPAAPTNVSATDGVHTDKVVVTWTKATGATGYQVYRDGVGLGWLGDVATYDDTGAAAPSITPGSAVASDGLYTAHVALSLSGQSVSNGTTHTYKVRARNAAGESADSSTNTGYRGVGTLTYQWQRSAGDSNGSYSDISGATTASYSDTGAPADGSGRYYRCVENATGAAQQTSTSNRGYRATYYASGYIGDVVDCTALVDIYDRLEWTEELDSQDIEVKIRSSPDASSWSTWETIYSSPCTSFTTPVQRYLEWRATLSSDTTATPKLKDLTFNWTKKVE